MITIICLDNDVSKKERRAYRVEETDNYYQLSRIFIDRIKEDKELKMHS